MRFRYRSLLALLPSLLVLACGPAPAEGEDVAETAQPLPACQPMIWETYGAPVFGSLNVVVKTANIGTSTCSYKVSVDVYKNGATYGGPIHSVSNQAPLSGSAPVKNTSSLFSGIARPCTYDVWLKVGSGAWYTDDAGPFWC